MQPKGRKAQAKISNHWANQPAQSQHGSAQPVLKDNLNDPIQINPIQFHKYSPIP